MILLISFYYNCIWTLVIYIKLLVVRGSVTLITEVTSTLILKCIYLLRLRLLTRNLLQFYILNTTFENTADSFKFEKSSMCFNLNRRKLRLLEVMTQTYMTNDSCWIIYNDVCTFHSNVLWPKKKNSVLLWRIDAGSGCWQSIRRLNEQFAVWGGWWT